MSKLIDEDKLEQREIFKGRIVLAVIIAIAVVFALIGLLTLSGKSANENNNKKEETKKEIYNLVKNFNKSSSKEYCAELYITGVIQEANNSYNQEWLLSTIDELKNDSKNVGIILIIDSPGGTVYESDETYLALLNYKKETERPVVAYFESLAASGGYYIGCAADYIYANRNTLTGSIGVIAGQSVDMTGLLEKVGIKSTTITAGKNKNMMNYNAPFTEEQKAIMQSIADDAYEQFTGIVAESRAMSIKEIQKLADGRIYTAKQAKTNKLIDEIGTLEDAEEWVLEYQDGDFSFTPYEYEYDPSFYDLLTKNFFNTNKKATLNDNSLDSIASKAASDVLYPSIKYPAYLYNIK